jgi:hypothetical protein
MFSQNEQLERQNAVREAFSQSLGLMLVDSEVTSLLEGKTLSLEKLMEYHSLTEIGTLFIRLDTLLRVNRTNQDLSALSTQNLNSENIAEHSRVELFSNKDCPDCPPNCRCEKVLLFICVQHCEFKPLDFHLSSDWLK